jgi:class 3 adenylate cyclase
LTLLTIFSSVKISLKYLDCTAIRPAVNIASRLQEAADANTILVSRSIAHYLNPREITPVKSLKLKGIATEIPAYAVKIETGSAAAANTVEN